MSDGRIPMRTIRFADTTIRTHVPCCQTLKASVRVARLELDVIGFGEDFMLKLSPVASQTADPINVRMPVLGHAQPSISLARGGSLQKRASHHVCCHVEVLGVYAKPVGRQ